MIGHGRTITWTTSAGKQSAGVHGCRTREDADREAIRFAKKSGWPGNPKWWQIWRIRDTKIEDEVKDDE